MNLPDLIARRESATLDFKREFHSNNAKFLHDVLCLSNAASQDDRYLIFGITNSGEVFGVDADKNKKNSSEVHDFLRQVHLNKIPDVDLSFHQHEGKEIGVLRISNKADKPYILTKDFGGSKNQVRAGAVYTRLGDTNIPLRETAPEDHVEMMWKERLSLLGTEPPDFESSFPIAFGHTREQVHAILGEPDDTGWQIEQFYNDGIEISYDQHFDFVDAICVYPLPVGTAFTGTLCGIKLGDTFVDSRKILGSPSHFGPAYENGSLAVWEIGERLLVAETWSSRVRTTTVPTSQQGTIKSISYCERKSTVGYNALVAIVIDKIRRGLTPTEFESPDLLTKWNVGAKLFLEHYLLLGARPAIHGGQEVLVAFPEAKSVVAFWIYPLEWRFPVVRAIYDISEPMDETSQGT